MSEQKMFNYLSDPNKIIAKYNVFIQLEKINRCIATYDCPKDENILTYVFAKTCMGNTGEVRKQQRKAATYIYVETPCVHILEDST